MAIWKGTETGAKRKPVELMPEKQMITLFAKVSITFQLEKINPVGNY
ncbi:hypothetical protein [Phocaeicola sp.]|jgi:hypothetical protein|nr:hypothetical protein [Phocaeicola sp.]